MSEQKIGYKDILRQKEYVKMIIAALINRFGDSIDAIASTWLVYQITESAAWSALIFGINRIPSIFITPLAGAWVEGRNKKRIMVITDLMRALCVACVATTFLLGVLQPWMLVLTNFIISTVEAFRDPACTALTPKILPKEYYSYGMSLESTLCDIMELIGMAAAAGIIALIGISGAIYIDMTTFLLSAGIILFVNSHEGKLEKQHFDSQEYFANLKGGFLYAKDNRLIRSILGIVVFLNVVLVPFNCLQAPLISEIYQGGTEVMSLMGISATVFMLLGSLAYPKLDGVLRGKTIFLIGGASIGVYYAVTVLCEPFYANKIFMYVFATLSTGLFGFCVAVANSYTSVEFMRCIDEKYLARVDAIMTALSISATPIASFVVSGLVAYISTATFFIVAGCLDIAACIYIVRSKALESGLDTASDSVEECAS